MVKGAAIAFGSLCAVGAGVLWYSRSGKSHRRKQPQTEEKNFSIGEDFMAMWPTLRDYLVEHVTQEYRLDQKLKDRVKWMLDYNCLGGKMYRGGLCMSIVRQLCAEKGLDYSRYQEKAAVLGWCIEILQACFLVADDVMDKSITRRGQPCWYKQASVQFDAVNDSLVLESFIFTLLKKYFSDDVKMYVNLLELYHKVMLTTEFGQMYDLVSQPQGDKSSKVLENFTEHTYKNIIQFKTADYTFYLSAAVAMTLCGYEDKSDYDKVYEICSTLGAKFQIQDDYLDAFGDPKTLGKIGTDIQDHKCTWLCMKALQLMTPSQRKIFEANYGKDEEQSVQTIKDLYRELKLPELYHQQQQQSYDACVELVRAASATLPAEQMFLPILKKLHGRDK
mmetsp:Transcript_15564/g.30559  ORF Transcript_15564/g.30559 Transcript_15564/m.30559 type:complete len:391 (+) Transcript_15564:31-1203(+)|eukprot:CAMPEP_0175155238 /NCGR_PEP_ID=MMETSP0087-20121206/20853_1 /TAXON_ID=136419 /ORGANISM="Unknown Unknown, Strain D1" /LENGTH=390 /DNA_ID=CAMNT_0016442349 /DNA_START=33 /DNA_END=1205 /DNA_ORIENTATION=-